MFNKQWIIKTSNLAFPLQVISINHSVNRKPKVDNKEILSSLIISI